jgi:aspartate dehydrogenase
VTARAGEPGRRVRVGLLGCGFVGAEVVRRLAADPAHGLALAFAWNRTPERLAEAGVPPAARLASLDALHAADAPAADPVVEMCHPSVTRDHGERLLARGDYLPLSVTALVDDALRARLVAAARAAGTTLAVPHGALVGLDGLREWRHRWTEVTVEFRKHPASIDWSESGLDPATLGPGATVVYDGPVRGIAPLFPRNVNTMVTCALATVGLDRCRARLVADPSLAMAVADVQALGDDGARLSLRKEQPMAGVSGTEMVESQWGSILRAARAREPFAFV